MTPINASSIISVMIHQPGCTFKFSTTLFHAFTEDAFKSLVAQVMRDYYNKVLDRLELDNITSQAEELIF